MPKCWYQVDINNLVGMWKLYCTPLAIVCKAFSMFKGLFSTMHRMLLVPNCLFLSTSAYIFDVMLGKVYFKSHFFVLLLLKDNYVVNCDNVMSQVWHNDCKMPCKLLIKYFLVMGLWWKDHLFPCEAALYGR